MQKSYAAPIGEGKSHQALRRRSAEIVRLSDRWTRAEREAVALWRVVLAYRRRWSPSFEARASALASAFLGTA
jgi:hypothetical protein